MKDTLQSPAFPGDHCSDIDKYIDSPPVVGPSMIAGMGTEAVKVNTFAYPLIAQAVRHFLPVPSAEVGIERVFNGGRTC